jgi:CheY-like chemotaxis protein
MSARILVVDDNEINLKLAAATLRFEGHEVITATDAESAQSLIRTGPEIDLILLDVSLPRMDGLTFTRILKADPATAQIPVLILTASAMRGDEQNARAAGADAFITKPINVGTFPHLITQHLKPSR